jgi:hypothetical protein
MVVNSLLIVGIGVYCITVVWWLREVLNKFALIECLAFTITPRWLRKDSDNEADGVADVTIRPRAGADVAVLPILHVSTPGVSS